MADVSPNRPADAEAQELLPPIPWGRCVVLPLVAGAVVTPLLVLFVDGPTLALVDGLRLPGDLKREIETFQQFGAGGSIIVTLIIIALLDRDRIRRALDLGLALLVCTILVHTLKVAIGRARPKIGDPHLFLGPTGTIEHEGRVMSTLDGASALHAMPSAHTTHAVILAVFLACLYPKLRWLMVGWALFVACGRVLREAHWPGDVALGLALAFPLAWLVITRYWGVRGLDWLWRRLIDRRAERKFVELVERDRRRSDTVGCR